MTGVSKKFYTNGYILYSTLRTESTLIPQTSIIQQYSTSYSERPDPKQITSDYVGPFDPISNIRQYVRHIPVNETPLQKRLREKRIEAEAWNHKFWERHNRLFYKEKTEFIKEQKLSGSEEFFQDKMSEFYMKFLNENHKRHAAYNWEWYRKNFDILLLSLRVKIEKALANAKTVHKK